jgi:hypothetical protein
MHTEKVGRWESPAERRRRKNAERMRETRAKAWESLTPEQRAQRKSIAKERLRANAEKARAVKAQMKADGKLHDADGVKKRKPVDFGQAIMKAYEYAGGEKLWQEYARQHPHQFLEEFVRPITLRQGKEAQEKARPVEENDGLEELRAFKREWMKHSFPEEQVAEAVPKPENGVSAPDQVDALAGQQQRSSFAAAGGAIRESKGELPALPGEPKPELKPQKPTLCPRCRPQGYPNCQECSLASDPGLALINGVIHRVRYPQEPAVEGCHRCDECNGIYHGVLPPFGNLKLCPNCRPRPAFEIPHHRDG